MKKKVLQKIFPALGTVNTVAIYSEYNPAILEQVMQRVLDLHQLFSIFDPQSEISRINENAGICSVPISEDTFSVLSLAIACAGETDGTFDITTGTLSRLWRDAINSKRIPSDAEIEQHHLLGSIADLELDAKNRTAFLRQAGIQLDLGGIAKGYAADEVQRILKENHIENALINLGGTVITIGRHGISGFRIHFRTQENSWLMSSCKTVRPSPAEPMKDAFSPVESVITTLSILAPASLHAQVLHL